MPIYEYRCTSCGNEFETLVRSDDTPECPSCHGRELDKKLSVFATSTQPDAAPVPSGCAGCPNAGGPGACSMN